jgi:hypothetical protein
MAESGVGLSALFELTEVYRGSGRKPPNVVKLVRRVGELLDPLRAIGDG